jgi:hypothetical protein
VFGSGVEDEASCVASAAWSVASNARRATSVVTGRRNRVGRAAWRVVARGERTG